MENKKLVSILMPTYNDASTILDSIRSVERQTSPNWELIIVNDGSSDETEQTLESYLSSSPFKSQIQVIHQTNQDQLVAILNGSQRAKGDYLYILHSDDLLYDDDSLKNFSEQEQAHPGYDAYTGGRLEVNDAGEIIRSVPTRDILPEEQALALTQLWLGRNIYMDVAFFEREAFAKHISENYLRQNMPYWIYYDQAGQAYSLKLYNMPFPLLRYRVHEGNYINSRLGAANVLSGELRCFLKLAARQHIPSYKTQFKLYRLLNKLKAGISYKPKTRNKPQENITQALDLIFAKAASSDLEDLPQFRSVRRFFHNRENSEVPEQVQVDKLPEDFNAPLGNQMRSYNGRSIAEELGPEHLRLLEQIATGAETLVCFKEDLPQLQRYLDYLGLSPYVRLDASH